MSHAEETSPLQIFPNKLKGDTLIVSPKGDAAGFSSTLFHKEQESLLKIMKDPKVDHLIIDFGSSTYFGSEMIGIVNQLITKVNESGGKTGVCNLSDDMKEGIHVMQLDRIWTLYDSRKDAVKAIVTEPMGQKIEHQIEANRGRLFILGIVTLVVAVVFVGLFLSARNQNRKSYNTMMTVWNELEANRTSSVSDAERKLMTRKNLAKVIPIVKRLEKRGARREAGTIDLLSAAQRLEVMLASTLSKDDSYFRKKKKEKKEEDPLGHKTPDELKAEFTEMMQAAHQKFGWTETGKKETSSERSE